MTVLSSEAYETTTSYRGFYAARDLALRTTVDVRLSIGPPGSLFSRSTAHPLAAAIGGVAEIDERTGYGLLDFRRAKDWRDRHLVPR